ncbi:MAG TPA: hypothetical protein VND23_09040 [Acidimicrobiales bacterium]|nr:hypothetical protein [Acidimicrobiales bacterium]
MPGAPIPARATPPAEPSGAVDERAALLAVVRDLGYSRRDEPFALSSGGTSHDYVDLRRAVARGADLRIAATAVLAAIAATGVGWDAIGGMTMGADPVAHAAALIGDRSWYSVRKAEKSHGSRRRIEGCDLGPGARVVVFEDTVTTGRSLLEALEAVSTTGADVVLACTMLDRGDAGARLLARREIAYLSLLTYRDLEIEPIVADPADAPGGDVDGQLAAGGERPPG